MWLKVYWPAKYHPGILVWSGVIICPFIFSYKYILYKQSDGKKTAGAMAVHTDALNSHWFIATLFENSTQLRVCKAGES